MILRGICLLFLGIGVFLLVQVAMPFLAFKTWEIFAYDKDQVLVNPAVVNTTKVLGINSEEELGVSVENIGNFPAFVGTKVGKAPYSQFTISIPRINLEDERVLVNSNQLDQALVHLPGSALPGQRGNVFVSGHSSISAILQSKGGKAFFVNLPRLKKEDLIYINALGQSFTYSVSGMKIVDPKDLSVINPPDTEGRFLTLMTCVPPGFNTKRLIVLAKLVQN